jgi:hypothetical protein
VAIPSITVEERDAQLGTIAAGPKLLSVIGEADAGPDNQPMLITKIPQLLATYEGGDLVEEVAELIARGVRCVVVKTPDDTSITAALEALKMSSQPFTHLYHLGDVTSADAAVLDSFCEEMLEEQNRRAQWYGGTRMFLEGDESVADYITEMTTIANAITTKYGSVAAGQLWTTSRVDGTEGYAPFSRFFVAQEMRIDLDQNSAELEFALPNCSAFDADGNIRDQVYLQNLHGGLAELQLVVPRTWPDRGTSCYVTSPFLMSGEGSDFQLTNHRAVMNLARTLGYRAYAGQLNKTVRVSKEDGRILEADAAKLEKLIQAQLDVGVLGKPYASGVTATIDREANLLSGAELELSIDIVPLVWTSNLRMTIGFKNPAIEVV